MAGSKSKRREITTDDLMRLQEGPPRKRVKLLEELSDDHSDASGSASDAAAPQGAFPYHDGEGLMEDGVEDEEAEDGVSSDDEDEDDVVAAAAPAPSVSRVTAIPRVQQPARAVSTNKRFGATSWLDLSVSSALHAALLSMSIRTPTEIQSACIPPLLAGRDCIGIAKTGSGKTIAFALPILQRLAVDPYGIFALVLTPTRELAFQIAEQFAVLGGPAGVRTAVVVGGLDMMAQALELGRRPHVVIATPGRLVDLLRSSSGEWDLSRIKFLVLDEADRLLTPTFAPELAYLFGAVPRERQTCLFTATWTDAVEKLADAPPRPGKQRPFVHRTSAAVETVETLQQFYLLVPSHVREAYLFHLLCNPPEDIAHMRREPPEPTPKAGARKAGKPTKSKGKGKKAASTDAPEIEQPPPTIIFCNKPRGAAYLTALLKTLGLRATALHSRLTQRERLTSLGLFRAGVVPVLICTDVGARGLDIDDVALVVNWDMPQEPEEYTHRVGRTARAGRRGMAVSFVTEWDEERVLKVEERINTKLVEMTLKEEKVLERLNDVSTARRLANMELHDQKFGEREEIHKAKRLQTAAAR